MKFITPKTVEIYRIAISGLLIAFGIKIVLNLNSSVTILTALLMVGFGFLLSKSTTKHFGHSHGHIGDSFLDTVPVAVLLLANIAHPAVDGFSLAQTFKIAGVFSGVLFALSILLHEILRQSALITALAVTKINWKIIVITAISGILLGAWTSVAGSNFFTRYEVVADLATLFSYAFIVGELFFLRKEHYSKYSAIWFIAGIVLGIIILKVTHAH